MMRSTSILYVMSGGLHNIKTIGQVMMFANIHQASLTLLEVIDSLPPSTRMLITAEFTADLRDRLVRNRLGQLEALVSRIRQDSGELRSRVRFGSHAKEIEREAAEGGYDLVIKKSQQGRTDKHLLRNCNCPVWLLKPDDYDASGLLLASRAPQFALKEKKLAVEPSLATGVETHASWFSRAQELFR